jgi:hypothetical protein
MRRILYAALAVSALACGDSSGPNGSSGLAGQWTSNQAQITGGFVSVSAVIAEQGGVLSGSGTLTVSGCPGSPYAVTLTGARAGTDVSLTLLPQNINFSGTYATNSITGTLTGLSCGGITIAPGTIVLTRQQ